MRWSSSRQRLGSRGLEIRLGRCLCNYTSTAILVSLTWRPSPSLLDWRPSLWGWRPFQFRCPFKPLAWTPKALCSTRTARRLPSTKRSLGLGSPILCSTYSGPIVPHVTVGPRQLSLSIYLSEQHRTIPWTKARNVSNQNPFTFYSLRRVGSIVPSSFLFLVVRPGAPRSVFAPSSKARSP